jgi:hypothetical protein
MNLFLMGNEDAAVAVANVRYALHAIYVYMYTHVVFCLYRSLSLCIDDDGDDDDNGDDNGDDDVVLCYYL